MILKIHKFVIHKFVKLRFSCYLCPQKLTNTTRYGYPSYVQHLASIVLNHTPLGDLFLAIK